MADQPSVPFQTRGGHTVNMQQPQRGVPANRVVPPTAAPTPPPQEPAPNPGEDADGRMVVRWTPLRSDGTARLELTDCVFDGLPPSPGHEQDLEARRSLGILTEVIALRAEMDALKEKLKEKGIEI